VLDHLRQGHESGSALRPGRLRHCARIWPIQPMIAVQSGTPWRRCRPYSGVRGRNHV
jgi:hypothetical protein